jgi:hypothetical protein
MVVRVRKESKHTKLFYIVRVGRRWQMYKYSNWNEEGEEHYQEEDQWIRRVVRMSEVS